LIAAQKVSINELNKKLVNVKKESATKKAYDTKMASMKDVMKKQNSLVREQQKAIRVMTKKLERMEKVKAKPVKAKVAKKVVKKAVAKRTSSRVKISNVNFDSRKGDLNSEWIEVKGKGNLSGYKLYDQGRKHVYSFPKGFKLDGKVRIYSGKGNDSKTRLFWNSPGHIWNNDLDVATLSNSKRKVVSKVKSGKKHAFEKVR